MGAVCVESKEEAFKRNEVKIMEFSQNYYSILPNCNTFQLQFALVDMFPEASRISLQMPDSSEYPVFVFVDPPTDLDKVHDGYMVVNYEKKSGNVFYFGYRMDNWDPTFSYYNNSPNNIKMMLKNITNKISPFIGIVIINLLCCLFFVIVLHRDNKQKTIEAGWELTETVSLTLSDYIWSFFAKNKTAI